MTDAEKVCAALREKVCQKDACGIDWCASNKAIADFVEAAQAMREEARYPFPRTVTIDAYDAALKRLAKVKL